MRKSYIIKTKDKNYGVSIWNMIKNEMKLIEQDGSVCSEILMNKKTYDKLASSNFDDYGEGKQITAKEGHIWFTDINISESVNNDIILLTIDDKEC